MIKQEKRSSRTLEKVSSKPVSFLKSSCKGEILAEIRKSSTLDHQHQHHHHHHHHLHPESEHSSLKKRQSSSQHLVVNSSALNIHKIYHLCTRRVLYDRKVAVPRRKRRIIGRENDTFSTGQQQHHHQGHKEKWEKALFAAHKQSATFSLACSFLFPCCTSKSTRNIVILFITLLLLFDLTASYSCQREEKKGENINEKSKGGSSSQVNELNLHRLRIARKVKSNHGDSGKLSELPIRLDPIIQTKQGLFKGIYLEKVASTISASSFSENNEENEVIGFFGIRYASAPVKRLRFMPPSPYQYAPNQIYNMQSFGPICWQRWPIQVSSLPTVTPSLPEGESELLSKVNSQEQFHEELLSSRSLLLSSSLAFTGNESSSSSGEEAPGKERSKEMQLQLMERLMSRESFAQFRPIYEKLSPLEQSEDCLNLNIYMPSQVIPGKSELAVLVIIHGDSFDYGAGSSIDASNFVRSNRLIVITFNFRLNILGFPPKLAGASRGNLGLMDQVAALHWIKENIFSFGGSPNNITLMGTKKGAIFVNLLALSPMAKGLFQRIIMQDGSALSPIVANHLGGSTTSSWQASGTQQQASNSLALQHVRVLAKLCECPVHADQLPRQQPPAAGSSSSNLLLRPENNGTWNAAGSISSLSMSAATSQPVSLLDEAKMNSLTFECLRHKPIELLMLHIPLHLIRTDPSSGGQLYLDLPKSRTSNSHPLKQPFFPASTSSLNEFIAKAHTEQLAAQKHSPAGQNTHLFSALYPSADNPPSALRPLFGPTLDGAILPANGEDLAELMLKRGSLFTQRDLLIGLSQVSPSPSSIPTAADGDQSAIPVHIQPTHLMADLISYKLQQDGLNSEQALEFVSTFVRSFYRYHTQEITNSIINNYLTNSGTKHRTMKGKSFQQLRSQVKSNQFAEYDAKLNQQLLILHCLLEAFHDALTIVPVLKATLIHATRQLDLIVDTFVDQQFENWKKQSLSSTKDPHFNRKAMLESFITFAQLLLNHTSYSPLQVHPSQTTNQVPSLPKSTYFYQFDFNILIKRVYKIILYINQDESLINSSLKWHIKKTLEDLVETLENNPKMKHQLGFNCIWQFENHSQKQVSSLAEMFLQVICSRVSASGLAQFVNTGRIFSDSKTVRTTFIQEELLHSSKRRFQNDCLKETSGNDSSVVEENLFSQQVASKNSTSSKPENLLLSESCKLDLNNIALIYLMENMDDRLAEKDLKQFSEDTSNIEGIWKTFNPFSQLKATLPAFPQQQVQSQPWKMSHIFSEAEEYDTNLTLAQTQSDMGQSLPARSSFWANFIPALNCTKTQPVIPSSLMLEGPLSIGDSSNSSLLTLNLLFSCQRGGTTSFEVIDSLADSAHSKLNSLIDQWILSNNNDGAAQQQVMISTTHLNHHNPRTANMSSKMDDITASGSQGLESHANQSLLTTPTNNTLLVSTSADYLSVANLRTKSIGLVLTITCGTLVASVLAISVAFVMKKQRNEQVNGIRESTGVSESKLMSAQTSNESPKPQEATTLISNQEEPENSLSLDKKQTRLYSSNASPNEVTSTPLTKDNSMEVDINKHYIEGHQEGHSQHICTMIDPNDNNYTIYWAHENGDPQMHQNYCLANDRIQQQVNNQYEANPNLCRNHSVLSVHDATGSSGYAVTSNTNLNIGTGRVASIIDMNSNEPIMVPLQMVNSDHQAILDRERVGTSRLTNGFYTTLDSSSESTQVQSSKRRVKIHDPLGSSKQSKATMRRRQAISSGLHGADTNLSSLSSENEQRNYCPMHGKGSSQQFVNDPNLETQYYIDSIFVPPNFENQVELCVDGSSYHQHPTSSINNFVYGANNNITRTTSFTETLNQLNYANNSNTLK